MLSWHLWIDEKNGVFFHVKKTFNTLSFRSVTKLVVVRFCWIFFWDWKCLVRMIMKGIYIFQKKVFSFVINNQRAWQERLLVCHPKWHVAQFQRRLPRRCLLIGYFQCHAEVKSANPKKWKFAKWRSNKYLNKYLTQRWVVSKICLFLPLPREMIQFDEHSFQRLS